MNSQEADTLENSTEKSTATEWKVPDAVCICNCITGLSHMTDLLYEL